MNRTSTATYITIAPRYRGPSDSGNGGYVCGMVASSVSEPVAVRLKRPPPLDVPLELVDEEGVLRLMHDDEVVAEARPDPVELEVPSPPGPEEASAASQRYVGLVEHPLPECFVCGPRRPAGDGLRIFAGPLSDRSMVAAPWVPDETLAGPDGAVRSELLWAALDCPGYFATSMAGKRVLLGELAVRIERSLQVDEPCVIVGWGLGSEGRKHFAGTAIFGPGGELVARARAIWIAPR